MAKDTGRAPALLLAALAASHCCDSLLQPSLQPLAPPAPPFTPQPRLVTGSDATCLELLILWDQAEPCPARWAHLPHVPSAHHRAQQTCEATSTAAWSLPPPRLSLRHISRAPQCPGARGSAARPWLGVPHSPPVPPPLRPAGPAAPTRPLGVPVAAGTRGDGRVRREEGRGRPTPPFRFPFFRFVTQRQRLCFLLQAAGPLPWGRQAGSLPRALGSAG